ncbi:hypothetical protein H311_02224 [Anncaliia algerae PRA109]|nr:hypothetical protein H311_02224 [Anncaliia algerae PRA109]
MLNFKCKDHRGRLPQNKTDGLCIVEVGNQITRAFATVIENKKSEHIMPIICSQVASGSIVWTDDTKVMPLHIKIALFIIRSATSMSSLIKMMERIYKQ